MVDFLAFADIADRVENFGSAGFQIFFSGGKLSRIAGADGDSRACFGEFARQHQTQAARAAGNQNDFVIQIETTFYFQCAERGQCSQTDRRRAIQEAYNIEHGITPKSIVKQVRDLTDRVKAQISDEYVLAEGEISAASREQSDGIQQVNAAIGQLDQMTQQNAALVEESAAAAESLKEQSQRLAGAISVFRLR